MGTIKKPKEYQAQLRGTPWTIRFTKENLGLDQLGICVYDSNVIIVEPKLTGIDRLDTVIHEMLHACLPDTAEHAINGAATEIAKALVDMKLAK